MNSLILHFFYPTNHLNNVWNFPKFSKIQNLTLSSLIIAEIKIFWPKLLFSNLSEFLIYEIKVCLESKDLFLFNSIGHLLM